MPEKGVMHKAEDAAVDFVGMLISSVVMIVLGIIYFGITLWIVKVSAGYFFGPGLEPNWAVLAAALLAVGGMSPNFSWTKKIYRG